MELFLILERIAGASNCGKPQVPGLPARRKEYPKGVESDGAVVILELRSQGMDSV
jgi:hypothetical protein